MSHVFSSIVNGRRVVSASLVLTLFMAPFFFGCTPPLPDGMPPLHQVTLSFVQDGKPMQDASVRLIPQDTSNMWSSGGSVDASGKCVLYTHWEYPGVPVGKYKICVTRQVREGETQSMDDMMSGKSTGSQKIFSLVESKYTLPNLTPLEIEVKEGNNSFEPFDLGKAVRESVAGPPA